jgi:hypothetical protein
MYSCRGGKKIRGQATIPSAGIRGGDTAGKQARGGHGEAMLPGSPPSPLLYKEGAM